MTAGPLIPQRFRPDGRPIRRVAFAALPIQEGTPYLSAFERLQVRPSIGLRYLAAVLEKKGVSVDVFDRRHDPEGTRDLPRLFNRRRYDLVGFYMTSASRKVVMEAVRQLDPDQYAGRILAGGPGTLHSEEILQSGIDLVVHGEAEDTIRRLLRAYSGDGGFADVRGLSFIDTENRIHHTGPAPLVEVSTLPFPSWKDHSPDFGDMSNVTMKRPFFVMLASRGCPFRCTFCSVPRLWDQQYRPRPVASVLDEMEWLVEEHGAKYIHFIDDVFAMAPGWLDGFCNGVRDRGISIEFSVILHPSSFRTDRARSLKRLRAAGCRLVSYGAQSADPDVLRAVRRSPSEIQDLREALAITCDLQIASALNFIVGLPGETRQSVSRTVEFVCEVKPTLVAFVPTLYLAGSELAESTPESRYSQLSPSEIQQLCAKAIGEYYFRAGGAIRLAGFILRHNPGWLLNVVPAVRFVSKYLALARGTGGRWGW